MADPEQTKIRGYQVPRPDPSALRTDAVEVTVKAEFRPGRARAGTERSNVLPLSKGDLVEIEYEDGLRIWLTQDEYSRKLEQGGKRDLTEPGVLDVPDSLPFGGPEAGSRGMVGWMLKSLKIVGIKFDAAKETATAVARTFESKDDEKAPDGRPLRLGPGLYRCRMFTGQFALEPLSRQAESPANPRQESGKQPDAAAAASPRNIGPARVLVLIHGTASSTYGSFGELWSPKRAATLEGLRTLYGDRVFGFDHRSMTVGPVENALELARELERRLADGTEIDLVSHSRGGLVGELMCRLTVADGAPPFDADDLDLAGRTDWLEGAAGLDEKQRESAAKALQKSAADLKELGNALAALSQRGIRIRRFVRVACPALGTSLVSRRLDRWAQILLNVGTLAARASPISELVVSLGDFIAAVIGEKTRPEVLPGLAAMLPDAGLLRAINNPTRVVNAELAVIAGDLEADGLWQRLLTLVADRFYDGEHDLVVNTGSMYGGAPREPGSALLAYQRGDVVNHFNYFRNDGSAVALLKALESKEFASLAQAGTGFEPMRPPVKPIAREVSRGSAGPRPVVFVLPGIMGSELAVGAERIWLNLPALFVGGLARLRVGAEGVVAKGIYAPFYEGLVDYLAGSHKVIAFPYDWRQSPDVEAKRLAVAVLDEVRQAQAAGQPVRIVAHSMGGLVARSMIAQRPDVWKAMTDVDGARLVMLGTPNGGSYSINELIVGQSSTIRRLALADARNRKRTILDVIARFPGVLSLLPAPAAGEDYLALETWQKFATAARDEWALPGKDDLEAARDFRQRLAGSAIDARTMVYVAGQARATLAAMRLEHDAKGAPRIRFRATNRGDGQVPWDSGIPAGLKAWYMPGVVHGNLASADEHFAAILDLLERGSTTRLRQDEPVAREAVEEFDVEVERGADDTLPDETAIAEAALGGRRPTARRRRTEAVRVNVTVMHGHLKFADWPVIVGHYRGDTIVSAEKVLDEDLGGRLTNRHRLGVYPDDLETCEVILRKRPAPSTRWRGAIVVGLGPVGELGVGGLTATIAHGAAAYAIKLADRDLETSDDDAPTESREIGVSSLLVGTNAGGVSVRDSVLAVLDGVLRANHALRVAKRPIRITSLELVELMQSRALQALQALRFFAEQSRLQGSITASQRLHSRRGARHEVMFEEPAGWWQRLQIKGTPREGEPDDGALRFVALTRRARAESRLVATQRALVERFVGKTIRDTRNDPELNRTLFELLLPNAIKEQAPNRDNMVLVLDEEAARYPWEMLENRWDGEGVPLALNRGLLRQLELPPAAYRETPISSLERNVLVVGDPLLPEGGPLRQLPGARAEAEAVARLFETNEQFAVTRQIGEGPGEIVRALFAQQYRIVHLAGHGVYEWQRPVPQETCDSCGQSVPEPSADARMKSSPVTGMVIGEDAFITPGEVEQMRRVPELVFINCCHLGRIEDRSRPAGDAAAGRDDKSERTDYHLFAANVASQFIRNGVRAVVAAGWAVDDAAGKTFAEAFYSDMLRGMTFGAAVLDARKRTAQAHASVNTWGAYQCYGDPDFVLVEEAARPRDEGQLAASLEQFVNRAEDLRAEISCVGAGSVATQIERLDKLRDLLAKDAGWSHIGVGWAALARVYNEAVEFDKAIECYEEALALEDGALTIRDIEQFANSECRAAVAAWVARFRDQTGTLTEAEEQARLPIIARLQSAIGRLERLNGPQEQRSGTVTSMRQALLGSAYKRHAWMCPGTDGQRRAERVQLLRESRKWYRGAATHRLGSPDRLVNWATVELALRWHGEPADEQETELAERLEAARAMLDARLDTELEVWDYAARAKLMLVLQLRRDAAGASQGERQKAEDELKEAYREIGRLANAREYASVLEQLQFLADMARYKDDDGKVAGDLEELLGSAGSRQRAGGGAGAGKRGSRRKRAGRGGGTKETGSGGKSGESGGASSSGGASTSGSAGGGTGGEGSTGG